MWWDDRHLRLHAVAFLPGSPASSDDPPSDDPAVFDEPPVSVTTLVPASLHVEDLVAHQDAGAVIAEIDPEDLSTALLWLDHVGSAIQRRILRPSSIIVVIPPGIESNVSLLEAIAKTGAFSIRTPASWASMSDPQEKILHLASLVRRLRDRGLMRHP